MLTPREPSADKPVDSAPLLEPAEASADKLVDTASEDSAAKPAAGLIAVESEQAVAESTPRQASGDKPVAEPAHHQSRAANAVPDLTPSQKELLRRRLQEIRKKQHVPSAGKAC